MAKTRDHPVHDRVQARLNLLTALEQEGKRLATATMEKIRAAMQTLTDLVEMDEPEEDAAEQACGLADEILAQEATEALEEAVQEESETVIQAVEGDYGPMSEAGYADPGYQKDKKPRYPLKKDGAFNYDRVKAAWGYINQPDNAAEYTSAQLGKIKAKIEAAAKKVDMEVDKQEATPAFEPVTQEKPVGYVIEQGEGRPALLIQQTHYPIEILEQDVGGKKGTVKFGGTATVADVINTQGQVYPKALWERQVNLAQERIQQGRLTGATWHPKELAAANGQLIAKPRDPYVHELSHKLTKVYMQDNLVKYEADTLLTDAGKNLAAVLIGKVGIDTSTRGSGTSHEGDWQGQSVELIDADVFVWYGLDAVLNGSSPGSAVDFIKLQEKPTEQKENPMLQKKIDAFVKTLTQGDAPEVPVEFAPFARSFLANNCQTADEVDAKKADLMQALEPAIGFNHSAKSKGMYAPEFNQDGTTKKKLENPEQAIQDILQSATKRGVLPEDTGVDDPRNMYRNAKIMLVSMAQARPAYVESYARMKSREIRDPADMKSFLQSKFGMLTQDIPTGAMTTDDVAAAIPYLMPTVTEMLPQSLAARYCSVQPMAKSKGTIAYWKIKDQDGTLIHSGQGANFTGSYAADPGEKQQIKKLKGALTTENIEPVAEKLGYDLSIEALNRLRSDWGMDGAEVMIGECATEIAMELNYQDLQTMVSGATAGNWEYGTAIPVGDYASWYDHEQWQKQLMTYIQAVRAGIFKKSQAGTVAILGDADAISRILSLTGQSGLPTATPGAGMIARGVNVSNVLSTGEELVSVAWWENLGLSNKLLVIGKGDKWYRSGYITAPYGGPYISPPYVDADTLDFKQAMMVERAVKLVDGNYMGTLTISSASGVPI